MWKIQSRRGLEWFISLNFWNVLMWSIIEQESSNLEITWFFGNNPFSFWWQILGKTPILQFKSSVCITTIYLFCQLRKYSGVFISNYFVNSGNTAEYLFQIILSTQEIQRSIYFKLFCQFRKYSGVFISNYLCQFRNWTAMYFGIFLNLCVNLGEWTAMYFGILLNFVSI